MAKTTKTSAFGVSKREGHDASEFYGRRFFENPLSAENVAPVITQVNSAPVVYEEEWLDRVYQQSATELPVPNNSVDLVFTSPPYNVGKEYDEDLSLTEFLDLITKVSQEVYRVLKPGGRYVINLANLGRKPYLPFHAYTYQIQSKIGFLPMGEIIWLKGKGANSSCAWGSWRSAKAPRLRDLHEYLLVFAKEAFAKPEKGVSDLSAEDFMQASLSVWEIPPVSAKKIGHPAPFPVALAERVIKFYSYVGDVVLDPFNGSGTTCVAAKKLQRHYVGVDKVATYCQLAERRLQEIAPLPAVIQEDE